VYSHPLRYRSNPVGAEYLRGGIADPPVNAAARRKAEAYAGVNCEAVVFADANHQSGPLVGLYWYGAVGFLDVPDCGLGSGREVGDEEGYRREGAPGAGVAGGIDVAVDGMEALSWG
jgi:hypothetical protein